MVSTHSSKAGFLGRIAARQCKVPVIFTAHGWAFTEGISAIQRQNYILIERYAAKLADKIICVSEHDRQLALQHRVCKPEQLVTIQNAMPFDPKAPLAKPEREEPVRLIMVARFSEQKDYQLLFKSLQEIEPTKNYIVDLVGDGPMLDECKQMVHDLNLQDRVNFLGARTDVPELLLNYQIFLLISKWEGFPRSILEAMRAGLPVIASDVGGTNEAVINNETGYLIPRGDLDTLAKRLQTLIDSPGLRAEFAQNGHERFIQNFTFDRLLEKTVQVYQEIIQQHRSPGEKSQFSSEQKTTLVH